MDLNLKINGDASGAVDALDDVAGATEDNSAAWKKLGVSVAAVGATVAAFAASSIKAFAESEKVQKQLTRAAGEYADVLSDQAEALSKLYAVDDDIIKQSQVLLTQWGGVGAASAETTKAILNFASAMGIDASQATQELIRNVESGGTGLAKMGVHFKATGDKGKDLAAAVEALNKKFGGAAAADADTLTGVTHAAALAFEDFQKSFGAVLSEMIRSSGVIPKVTDTIRSLTKELFTPQAAKDQQSQDFVRQQLALYEQVASGKLKLFKDIDQTLEVSFDEAQAQVAKWTALLQTDGREKNLGDGAPRVTGTTNKGLKSGDKSTSLAELNDKSMEEMKKYYAGLDQLEATAQAQEEQAFADSLAAEGKHVKDVIQTRLDGQKAYDDIRLSEQKKTAEHAEKLAQEEMKARDKASKESADRAKKQEQDWKNAGDQIGAAFVNALGDQLSKLAAGEEFDAALFVGDILASVISVAATIIGTAYGQPALGAAVGNLAAMGVRAGAGAISAGNKKQKMGTYHEGGWVGDEVELPRHHSGAWIAPDEQQAILQHGERVLSRREVASMGGPRGVDAAAKGGGMGISVSVMAIDAKNAAEGFVGNLGLGLKRALRTGQGDVPRLLGVSPR